MPRRLYDPLSNPEDEDPLGPAPPGVPRASAPTVARTALLDGLSPADAPPDPSAPQTGTAAGFGIGSVPKEAIYPEPEREIPPPELIGPPVDVPPGRELPPPAYDGGPETIPPDPIGGRVTAPPNEARTLLTESLDPQAGAGVPTPIDRPLGSQQDNFPDGLPAPWDEDSSRVTGQPVAPPVLAGQAPSAAGASYETPGDDTEAPPPPPTAPPPAATPAPTAPLPIVVTDGTPEAVKAIYAKYKMHVPSDAEIQAWLDGTFGGARTMAAVEEQIAASEEARRLNPGHDATDRMNPTYVDGIIQGWMANNNPRGHKDPEYWKRRILETGGLGADNMAYWLGRFTEAEGTHQEGPPAAPPGGPAGPAAPPVPGGGGQPGIVQESAFNRQLREFLMSQLGGLSTSIDENNPELQPAISAYRTQSQRDQQSERDLLAERAYASGELNTGGFDTRVQQGFENAAGKRANFAGSMVYQANVQRRQQLQAMLQTAVSAGLTDQAQAIQQNIAKIDADLRRLALDQQNSQFGDSLGLSYAQLLANMNRDALLTGLNG